MLEDSPEAAPPPSELEVELTAHIWNYYRDKRWRVPRYVVEHLNRLSSLSLRLGETIEREGMPILEATPDRQLAREARQLGWSLIHRAALLDDGQGDEPIRGSKTGETYKVKTTQRVKECTVRNWVRYLTEESGDRTLTAQIQRQHEAELVLEMKANLLACFEASKKLYNALKLRKPTGIASEERDANLLSKKRKARIAAEGLFAELLPKSIPWPLTNKIKASANAALATVLVDMGSARTKPSEAIVEPIQMATDKYLGRKVAPDLVRQAASYTRKKVEPDSLLIAAIAQAELRHGVRLRPSSSKKPIR